MADGRVVIDIVLNDGSVVKGVADIDEKLKGISPSAQKANSGIKDIVTSLGLVKVASMAFDVLKSSMDAAISRFDTMQRYPKVMSALGYSTEESSESVNKLADGIDGLPTKLDEVVSTSQRMTAITGNLDKSTNATLALNNAMLASGASTADASRGMDQYIQMLSTGTVDLQSWKTLQETMPIGLQKTAEAMGFLGETAQRDLYSALKDGTVTFNEFQNELIKLGTGTGELAELAKVNSEGIATSFGNLKNAASKGIANIITDLDKLSTEVIGKNIAQNIDGLKVVVNSAFNAIGKAIEMTTPIVKLSAEAFKFVFTVGQTLSPVLLGVAAGYAALKAIQGINDLINRNRELFGLAGESGKALNIVLKAQTAAQVANTSATTAGTVATKAQTLAEMAKNGQITISSALIGVLTGGISAQTVATTLATAATTAFSAALKILAGPVGWVVAAIGLLVAGATALWKWLNKDSEATKKLKKEQEELESSTTSLNDSIKQNASNRKEELTSIESNSKAYKELAKSVVDLADKESKTAAEKKLLKEQVEQLNTAYSDLNLKYDEETGKLSMSTDALNKKIEAYKEQDTMVAGQEKLLEISKEQADVDAKLGEVAELRAKYNEQLNGSWKEARSAKEGLKELDEQEKLLLETQEALQTEYSSTSEVVKQASEAAAQAVEDGATRQQITYESLTEGQQAAVNSMRETFQSLQEAATNAFEKMSTDAEIGLGEMVENMTHNQEVVRQWGENQAALLQWAGQNGYDNFIPFIESIGVDQAGVLAEMVQGIDGTNAEQAELLRQLAETYQQGFGTAAEAGKNSMKLGLEGLPEEIKNMVITPTESLNAEVKTAFEGMGKNIGEGASAGINATKKNVEDSSKQMAEAADNAFSGHMQIKSPSRLFRGYGEFIGQGLVGGMDSQRGAIEGSINQISESLKRPFDSSYNDMYQIGSYMMDGLNAGLSSRAGSVYATAQAIANNVKSTIQSAMDINSPSRWMKNFIGKNMMVGWQIGLEEYGKLPVRAMQRVKDNIQLPVMSAESLLGVPGGTTIHNVQNTVNNTSKSSDGNSSLLGVMSEQNRILKQILAKDTTIVVNDEPIARAVNRVNALDDSIRIF